MSFLISTSVFTPFIPVASYGDLPAASSVQAGEVYRVEGIGSAGFSFWISDGQFWRPQNGSVELFASAGYSEGVSFQPLATLTTIGGNTYVPFILSSPLLIPAGLLAPSSRLVCSYRAMRQSAGAGSIQNAWIADPLNGNVLISSGSATNATAPACFNMYVDLVIPDSKSWINGLTGPQSNRQNGATTSMANIISGTGNELTNDVNEVELLFGGFSFSSLIDVYSLYAYRVRLEF